MKHLWTIPHRRSKELCSDQLLLISGCRTPCNCGYFFDLMLLWGPKGLRGDRPRVLVDTQSPLLVMSHSGNWWTSQPGIFLWGMSVWLCRWNCADLGHSNERDEGRSPHHPELTKSCFKQEESIPDEADVCCNCLRGVYSFVHYFLSFVYLYEIGLQMLHYCFLSSLQLTASRIRSTAVEISALEGCNEALLMSTLASWFSIGWCCGVLKLNRVVWDIYWTMMGDFIGTDPHPM